MDTEPGKLISWNRLRAEGYIQPQYGRLVRCAYATHAGDMPPPIGADVAFVPDGGHAVAAVWWAESPAA